jgi:hypothetical protein
LNFRAPKVRDMSTWREVLLADRSAGVGEPDAKTLSFLDWKDLDDNQLQCWMWPKGPGITFASKAKACANGTRDRYGYMLLTHLV